jgi:hypothetical protein
MVMKYLLLPGVLVVAACQGQNLPLPPLPYGYYALEPVRARAPPCLATAARLPCFPTDR